MKQHWLVHELEEQWSLSTEEQTLLSGRTSANKLGFAATLKFMQIEGRFPKHFEEIPLQAREYLAKILGLDGSDASPFAFYERTAERYRATIRSYLAYRPATVEDTEAAQTWLVGQQAASSATESTLLELLRVWFRENKIEPPTLDRQHRLIKSVVHAAEKRCFDMIANKLSATAKDLINVLVDETSPEASQFISLRSDPGRVGLESVLTELDKLAFIERFGLRAALFAGIPANALHTYRLRVAKEPLREIRRHAQPQRDALVAMFCWERRQEIIDGLGDLLIQVIHKITVTAERRVIKELVQDIRAVRGKNGLLYRLADAALEHPDETVREALYTVVNEETLQAIVKEYRAKGPGYQRHIQTIIHNSYKGHYRRMLPLILRALRFRSNNAQHRPIIDALDYLKDIQHTTRRFLDVNEVPLTGIVPRELRPLVIESDGKGGTHVHRVHYEICLLQALRERLRCKEVWIEGANRYRNPDEDVPQDFPGSIASRYYRLQQWRRFDRLGRKPRPGQALRGRAGLVQLSGQRHPPP